MVIFHSYTAHKFQKVAKLVAGSRNFMKVGVLQVVLRALIVAFAYPVTYYKTAA